MEMLCDLSSVIYPKWFILCDFHFQTLKKYFHNSNSRVSWRCMSRRTTHQEELRSFSKVQNLRHVLRRWWACVPFLWWIGGRTDWVRLRWLLPRRLEIFTFFLFFILLVLLLIVALLFLQGDMSYSTTPTDELQSFCGMYWLGSDHTFL